MGHGSGLRLSAAVEIVSLLAGLLPFATYSGQVTEGNKTLEELKRDLSAALEDVARLRVENLELRDAMQGLASYERSADHLMHENRRLMYLVRRPWRTARIASQSLRGKVRRRYVSWRSPN